MMNPSRNLHPHPLAGYRLIALYVALVVCLAILATVVQQGA